MNYYNNYETNIETIQFEMLKVGVSYRLSMQDLAMANVSPEVIVDQISHELVYQLTARVASRSLEELKCPSDWKQAFKERWFPEWLLKKYPVKYEVYDVKAVYPGIEVPGQQHFIHVLKVNK